MSGEIDARTQPECGTDSDYESEETFVDVVGDVREQAAEFKRFTVSDTLIRANLLSQTVSESVVNTSELPVC